MHDRHPHSPEPLSPESQLERASGMMVADALSAWCDRILPVPPDLLEDAREILGALERSPAPPELEHLAQAWVACCQASNLSLAHALSLFTECQARMPLASHSIGECSLRVAQAWLDAETSALQKTNRMLREADKNRTDFISTYSHELRTPLTAIIGACELLLDDFAAELSGPQFEYMTMISQGSALIRQLIDDVLDFEKLQARRLDLHLEPLDLESIMQEMTVMVAPLIQEKGLIWDLRLDPQLPCIQGDAVRIRQILLNLLSNAIKFTPRGGTIRLSAQHEKLHPRRREFIAITIADSGIGIAPEHHKLIFARFRQVQDHFPQGTGLGLAITKKLVDLHSGRISLSSLPGQGAAFTFTIPLALEP